MSSRVTVYANAATAAAISNWQSDIQATAAAATLRLQQ